MVSYLTVKVQAEFSHNKENLKRVDSSEMLSDKINFLIHKCTQNYVIWHREIICNREKKDTASH